MLVLVNYCPINEATNGVFLAEGTISWEILPPRYVGFIVITLTTMNDEIFVLYGRRDEDVEPYAIKVFDAKKMGKAKGVIPLSDICPIEIAACSASSCVYLLYTERPGFSISRITKDSHQFRIAPWIENRSLPSYDIGPMSLSAGGNLMILSRHRSPEPTAVVVYAANGSVLREITLWPGFYGFSYVRSIFEKSCGSLVFVSVTDQYQNKLLEIEKSGRIVHEYQSRFGGDLDSFEDICGRVFVISLDGNIEVLDSELKLLDAAVPRLVAGDIVPYEVKYIRERHEIVGHRFVGYRNPNAVECSALVIFRVAEE